MLSGVLLNCALYAVTRFLPIIDAATGNQGWPSELLIPFGLISVAGLIVNVGDGNGLSPLLLLEVVTPQQI